MGIVPFSGCWVGESYVNLDRIIVSSQKTVIAMSAIPVPETLYPELKFLATRSSGAGGQHVNKVSTRVELRFDIPGSALLSDDQKAILLKKLASRINKEGELIIISQKTRSQLRNKEDCIVRFSELIKNAFRMPKKRIPTKPSLRSRLRRLESKKLHSSRKEQRRKPDV